MKNIFNSFLILFLIPVSNFAQSKDVLHLAYGQSPQQTLDLYLPEGNLSNKPVLIMLHGGAWSMGGLEYTTKHSKDLRDRGLIVANVDYRYVSDKISAKDLLQDIDNAVKYVSTLSSEYGYTKKGYHIAGISAGAHLALLYGFTKHNMKSITALCAPSRLDQPERDDYLPIFEKLAGAKLDEKGPNPAFVAISPFHNITNVPTFLIHGDADTVVPVKESQDLYAELQKKHIESRLEIRTGKGHDVGMNSADTEVQNITDISDWVKQHN